MCDGGRVRFLIIRGCAATRVLLMIECGQKLVHSFLHLRSECVVDLWIHNLRNNSVNTRLQHSWSETQDNLQKGEKTKTKIKVVLNNLLLSKAVSITYMFLNCLLSILLGLQEEYTTENEIHTTLAFNKGYCKKKNYMKHVTSPLRLVEILKQTEHKQNKTPLGRDRAQ